MGRGRDNPFDGLAALPWPVALVVGLLGYAAIRHGVPAYVARLDGPLAQALAMQRDALAPIAWLFLGGCSIASLAAFVRARRRRRLLDACTQLDHVAALGWRDFERLVGEAFRRQGYGIEETGLGGADGGIDLILHKGGQRTLVQCKQWRRRQVPVGVVREMYGLLAHHRAQAVRIAALGGFTRDAARFAQGKPIDLIDGPTLLAMIRSVQAAEPSRADTRDAPVVSQPTGPVEHDPDPGHQAGASTDCPRCGATMVRRANRRTGATFWGCSGYPACRGTR
ncbi:restriction endonuclease [Luteimonas sp. RC10]|uniref:restriction endonuclease n=1 Tax=Luteimonas sp. RC10 TaxID=2587035 RepID=UPI00160BA319|nr:restriction endonuclease [Luteimonas sp. RC10]MBB3342743.1 restriction system protein [Luteimonas sp. RC10]